MKEIEYIEINGLLYPKLTLPPQKEIHLTRFGRKRLPWKSVRLQAVWLWPTQLKNDERGNAA